jgi:hypothetical protein
VYRPEEVRVGDAHAGVESDNADTIIDVDLGEHDLIGIRFKVYSREQQPAVPETEGLLEELANTAPQLRGERSQALEQLRCFFNCFDDIFRFTTSLHNDVIVDNDTSSELTQIKKRILGELQTVCSGHVEQPESVD